MAWREKLTIGELTCEQPPKVPVYTLATVPDAAKYLYGLIVVSDATPNNLCWSDGTNWIACDDGTTVA